MNTKTSTTVSAKATDATINLIQEYLFQGGSGHDAEALEEMLIALQESGSICIEVL